MPSSTASVIPASRTSAPNAVRSSTSARQPLGDVQPAEAVGELRACPRAPTGCRRGPRSGGRPARSAAACSRSSTGAWRPAGSWLSMLMVRGLTRVSTALRRPASARKASRRLRSARPPDVRGPSQPQYGCHDLTLTHHLRRRRHRRRGPHQDRRASSAPAAAAGSAAAAGVLPASSCPVGGSFPRPPTEHLARGCAGGHNGRSAAPRLFTHVRRPRGRARRSRRRARPRGGGRSRVHVRRRRVRRRQEPARRRARGPRAQRRARACSSATASSWAAPRSRTRRWSTRCARSPASWPSAARTSPTRCPPASRAALAELMPEFRAPDAAADGDSATRRACSRRCWR